MNTSFMRSAWRNEDGTAAVEFALVLPIFLTLLLGILAYGIYFAAAHSTAQLAADAARASVAGLTDTERSSIARASVANNVRSYGILLDARKVIVEAAAVPSDATEFRVAVRYDAAILPLPSSTIEQTAIIKRGGY